MSHNISRLLVIISLGLWLSGCVTTTTSRYDAKKDLEKAVLTYTQIGYGYFQQGSNGEAKRALDQAIDIDPKASGAHLGLARVYEQEGEYELADDHFQKAIRYGGDTEVRFQYGAYLYNRADFEGAFIQFKKTLEDTSYVRRAQTFEYQGLVATRLGDIETAVFSYERAIRLNKMMANSYLGLTNIYFEQEDYATAYRHYRGFSSLVRAQLSRHTASTLWTGIQLASLMSDEDGVYSYTLQLRNQFPKSAEYARYLEWKEGQGAI